MGVSLERVQNKFACIIGELCNEPLVLSQFAIWLDMRLAEYKAKGSICLECCGDIPKPTWLKGLPLKDTIAEIVQLDEGWPPGMLQDDTGQGGYSDDGLGRRTDHDGHHRHRSLSQSRQFHPASRRSDNGTHSSSHPISPKAELDLTSDILIKQEAYDSSDNLQVCSHLSDWRKRPSDRDYGSAFPSHPKSQRLSSDVTPLNEPLTAIINRAEATDSQPGSAIDKLSAMTEQSFNQNIQDDDDDDDIQVEIISGPSSILPASSSNINPYPGTSSADFGSPLAADNSELDSSRLSQNDSLLGSDMANSSDMNVDYNRSWNPNSNLQATSTNHFTQRKTASSVGLFQRWLASKKDEFRAIRMIPPAELDPFLVTFLTTCKKIDGGEYSAKSLKGLRESIERHLKETGYPESIVTSWAFLGSQTAYRTRFRQLLTAASSNIRLNHENRTL